MNKKINWKPISELLKRTNTGYIFAKRHHENNDHLCDGWEHGVAPEFIAIPSSYNFDDVKLTVLSMKSFHDQRHDITHYCHIDEFTSNHLNECPIINAEYICD